MCCNVRGCIGFVIGVIFTIIIAILTFVGVYFGVIFIPLTAGIIIALSVIFLFFAVLFLTNTSQCCLCDEKMICKLKTCIKTIIITGIIAIILATVVLAIYRFFTTATSIILPFAVIALLIVVFSFIWLIICRTEHCKKCEDECERERR